MKPTTEGSRLRALREALDATQDLIAELGGIKRVTIVRAETNKVKWRSTELREGLMKAYSMTYEQLSAYIAGEMSLKDAIAIAHDKIAAALRAGATERSHEKFLEDVFRRASAHEDILQATKDAASVVFSEAGCDVPMPTMVKQVITLNHLFRKHISDSVRAVRSDLCAPK